MPPHVAIVGAGPAGLFLAKNLLKLGGNQIKIDIMEKLPTAFGLLKYGIAPDQQDVKAKFMNHFTDLFADPRIKFLPNNEIGSDIGLDRLQMHYDVVALCTGMQTSRRLFPDCEKAIGADNVVAWYNEAPHAKNISNIVGAATDVSIIGNGNVALDIARLLLKSEEQLQNLTISASVKNALIGCGARTITMIGRRGPVNAACTPPELRQFGKLKDHVKFVMTPDLSQAKFEIDHISRIQKKNIDIFKELQRATAELNVKSTLNFFFDAVVTSYTNNIITVKDKSGLQHRWRCDLLIESIGFYQNRLLIPELQTDPSGAYMSKDYWVRDNIFACGWGLTGAKGTVGDTMLDAENCARLMQNFLDQRPSQ